MKKLILTIRNFFEFSFFGVCTWLGDKMGVPHRHIRLFFVYASFVALTSSIVVYMSMAFLLNLKNYIQNKSSRIWDL